MSSGPANGGGLARRAEAALTSRGCLAAAVAGPAPAVAAAAGVGSGVGAILGRGHSYSPPSGSEGSGLSAQSGRAVRRRAAMSDVPAARVGGLAAATGVCGGVRGGQRLALPEPRSYRGRQPQEGHRGSEARTPPADRRGLDSQGGAPVHRRSVVPHRSVEGRLASGSGPWIAALGFLAPGPRKGAVARASPPARTSCLWRRQQAGVRWTRSCEKEKEASPFRSGPEDRHGTRRESMRSRYLSALYEGGAASALAPPKPRAPRRV